MALLGQDVCFIDTKHSSDFEKSIDLHSPYNRLSDNIILLLYLYLVERCFREKKETRGTLVLAVRRAKGHGAV